MGNKDFDKIVRQKLDNLNAPFDSLHWDRLKSRLDGIENTGTPDADVRAVDEVYFDKLHSLEASYEPAHWKQMSGRLDEVFTFPRRVYQYKLAELALMLLLLITFYQYFPLPVHSSDPEPAIENPVILQAQLDSKAKNPSSSSTPNQLMNFDIGVEKGINVSKNAIVTASKLLAENETNFFPSFLRSKGESDRKVITSELDEINTILTNIESEQKKSILYPIIPKDKNLLADLQPLSSVSEPLQADELLVTSSVKKILDGTHLRFGMFSSVEYNYIMTPYDEVFDREAYNQFAPGYGGGFSIGVEKGKWEIETGAIYSAKHYLPRSIKHLYGDIEKGFHIEELKDIQINILNIPFNIRYHFVDKPKWRFSTLGGFSAQIAFQANYDRVDISKIFGSGAPSDSGVRSSKYDEKPFKDGWFEGGTFKENSYYTANIGLSVERFLTPQWSIFVQPTYYHQLKPLSNGLGPNYDRIHTLSILAGAKVRL